MKSVAHWLEQQRPAMVEHIVRRICDELPDYRRRPADQLALAAGAAYDQWYTTILENDLMRYAREAEAVIEQSLARGDDPNQLSRVPAVICAVVLERLDQAGPAVDPAELAAFQVRARRMTTSILGVGGLRIARGVLKKATDQP